MHYVYLLESLSVPSERYVGETQDLKCRLADHNGGKSVHTAKFRPWNVVTYLAFSDRRQALVFERYLKSGSCHAFAKRRLWPSSETVAEIQPSGRCLSGGSASRRLEVL